MSGRKRDTTGKLEAIARRRRHAHGTLVALKSKVYEAFLEMEKAAYRDGELPRETKELIAVGISVVLNCESCMQWHIEQAAKAGASMRQALEAVEVGIEMGGGPATVSARFALEVMEAVFEGPTPRAFSASRRAPSRRQPPRRRPAPRAARPRDA